MADLGFDGTDPGMGILIHGGQGLKLHLVPHCGSGTMGFNKTDVIG